MLDSIEKRVGRIASEVLALERVDSLKLLSNTADKDEDEHDFELSG